jgi:hypothetical protein
MRHRALWTCISLVACTAAPESAAAPSSSSSSSSSASSAPELLPILRQWCGALPGPAAAWCAIATDAASWRALRARLGPVAGNCLGADFELPPGARVLVVAAAAGLVAGSPPVRVATEEGVDVVTVTTAASPSPDVATAAPVLVLLLPERRHQLAVVLAEPDPAYGVAVERLLAVFEPR